MLWHIKSLLSSLFFFYWRQVQSPAASDISSFPLPLK
jgi:hypothetical protein